MYGQQQSQGLPVNPFQPDQSTMIGGLPDSNDTNLSNDLRVPPQVGNAVAFLVGSIRKGLQDRANKSPVHCVAYNLACQNYFRNNTFIDYCQRAIDYLAAVAMQRGTLTAQDVQFAVDTTIVYLVVTITTTYQHHPDLASHTANPAFLNALQQYQNAMTQFETMVNGYRQSVNQQARQPQGGGWNQQQGNFPPQQQGNNWNQPQQNFGQGFNQPQGNSFQNAGSFGQQNGRQNSNFGNQGHSNFAQPSQSSQGGFSGGFNPNGNVDVRGGSGMGFPPPSGANQNNSQREPVRPPQFNQQPTQGGANVQQPQQSRTKFQEIPVHQQQAPKPQSVMFDGDEVNTTWDQPVPHATEWDNAPSQSRSQQTAQPAFEYPVPKELDDIVMDPAYFPVPEGKEFDPERPFDHFYAPGGIEIFTRDYFVKSGRQFKGAFKCFIPYTQLGFVVAWPDGKLSDYIVNAQEDMEYARHELVERLRISKESTSTVADDAISAIKVWREGNHNLVIDELKDLDAEKEEAFDVLEGVQEGTTEYEVESLIEQERKENDQPTSNYAYTYRRIYPITGASEDGQSFLAALATSDGPVSVATSLVGLMNAGDITEKTFRMVNNRLTDMLNIILRQVMVLDFDIDSFSDDVGEICSIITEEEGTEGYLEFKETFKEHLANYMTFEGPSEVKDEETEETIVDLPSFSLVDYKTVVSLDMESIALGEIDTVEPSLLSRATYPHLVSVLHQGLDQQILMSGSRLSLKTKDGVEFNVVKNNGTGALMITRLLSVL